MSHSRAPFLYVRSHGRAAILDGNGVSIASLITLSPPKELDSNGALFSAAPELLEACKLALSSCDPHSEFTRKIMRAIAKAEGTEK
jgi:hypothetical protein